jgi:RNA methyltransferase, TrmH family
MFNEALRKKIKKLQQKKYREEYGLFVVEGVKGVSGALNSNAEIEVVVVEKKKKSADAIRNVVQKVVERKISFEYCLDKDVNKIKSTETFPGILALVKIKNNSIEDLQNDQPIILLDKISDPGNMGTILRTADWFGVGNILVSSDSVDPYNEKVVRASMGSIFRIKLAETDNTANSAKQLKKLGYTVVSLSTTGEDLSKMKPRQKTIYIFGSESHGIRPELEQLSDKMYTISGKGTAESLNVAVSAGILLNKIS